LPDWYIKNKREIKKKAFATLTKFYKTHFIFKGHKVIKDGRVWLWGNSSAELYGSSSAVVYNCKNIKVKDRAAAIDRRENSIKLITNQ